VPKGTLEQMEAYLFKWRKELGATQSDDEKRLIINTLSSSLFFATTLVS